MLRDAREHSDDDPLSWLIGVGPPEFREISRNNALYIPFLGPVMPLLFYIGLGMIEDLAEFPNQFLAAKTKQEQILIEGCVYARKPNFSIEAENVQGAGCRVFLLLQQPLSSRDWGGTGLTERW